MKARDKARRFSTPSYRETRDVESNPDYEKELATAYERFATVLRTAPVETTKTGLRDIRRAPFSGDERPLWTTTFESEWHRYFAEPSEASTIH
jgi:hypothetical protein